MPPNGLNRQKGPLFAIKWVKMRFFRGFSKKSSCTPENMDTGQVLRKRTLLNPDVSLPGMLRGRIRN